MIKIPILLTLFLSAPVFAQNKNYGDPVPAYPSYPSWQECAVLVLTDACRIDPVGFRTAYLNCDTILKPQNYPAAAPLYWNVNLNRSSRAHSADMAAVCGMQHNSCNGTAWDVRLKSYYTPGYPIGENIATGYPAPLDVITGWLKDGNPPAGDSSGNDGHRANIMDPRYKELGAGYGYGSTIQWYHFWTQDFGGGTSQYVYHPVAGGSHQFPNSSTIQFLAAFYDPQNLAPQEAAIYIDGTKYVLTRFLGTNARGTYALSQTKGTACRRYHFSFTRSGGAAWRYPESGELVTYGEGSCQTVYLPPESLSIKESNDVDLSNINGLFGLIASPSALELYVSQPHSYPRTVQLTTIHGTIVQTWMNASPSIMGDRRLVLPIATRLSSGVYLVKMVFADGTNTIAKIVVFSE